MAVGKEWVGDHQKIGGSETVKYSFEFKKRCWKFENIHFICKVRKRYLEKCTKPKLGQISDFVQMRSRSRPKKMCVSLPGDKKLEQRTQRLHLGSGEKRHASIK